LNNIATVLTVQRSTNRHIYIYPTQSELQQSLRQAGINLASAHALPELGVVLVAGGSDAETLIRLEREIPHELTHLLLYERMGPSLINLPVWLNEGLATSFERSPRRLYTQALEQALERDELLQMESLCASFPISEQDRQLAYAQSASFTNYLADIYGVGGIVQLLDAYEEGTSCTGGVQRVFQRSLGQLESEWRQVAFDSVPIISQPGKLFYFAAVGSLASIAVAAAVLLIRRRRGT
jgi:hypothetical protein